jgi:hypothetical protein
MPPSLPDLPTPRTRGRDAAEWLSAHGITSRVPDIHSSDIDLAFRDPFLFYLVRRLGLRPAFSHSAALNRGSWVHKAFEYLDMPASHDALQADFEVRCRELTDICSALGIVGERRQDIMTRELRDVMCAEAWVSLVCDFRHAGTTIRDLVTRTYQTPISKATGGRAIEYRLDYDHPFHGRLVGRADRLLYHPTSRKLWIADYKSCGGPVHDYLQGVSLSWQTRLYLYILRENLASILQDLDLPADTQVGGMMHIAFQKPTISFGMKDRDFTLDESPLKSGPRKGQPRNERVYSGEPKLENYVRRTLEWYKGEGEYTRREGEPDPIGLSFTHADFLDSEVVEELNMALEYVAHLCRRPAFPNCFPRNPSSVFTFRGATQYAPFYVSPITSWPEIMLRENFIQFFREEDEELESE